MGILQKLKSVLGMDRPSRPRTRSEPDVTVEREPSTETEQAVKGGGPSDAPRAPRSANASATDADAAVDETASTSEAETDAETDETATAAGAATDAGGGAATASPPVEEVTGIGPTYAERLEAAGIETVADLADSDVATVADAAQTNESRAEDWLAQARDW